MKKTVSILLCLFIVLSLLAGCSTEKSYRDDTAPQALIENAERKLVFEEGVDPVPCTEITLRLTPGLSDAIKLSDQYLIKDTAGESSDEYGILHIAKKEDVASAVTEIEKYLENRQKSADSSTLPDKYKLDEWEVKTFGNYIVFATLTAENRTVFFSDIEQLLLEV